MYLNIKQKGIFWSSAKTALALLIIISSFVSAAPFALAEDEPEEITTVDGLPCKSDEVLVKFSEFESTGEISLSLNSVGSEVEKTLPADIVIADVPTGETVESFMEELEATPGVEHVQPNYVYTLDAAVDDPYYVDGTQWYLDKIGVYDAWDITMGSADIKIAVLDSGIDVDHEDLASQIYLQKDVVDNDGSADDDNGHGTHVAGIIAAEANNATGVAGIAPLCKLIAIDVFYKNDEGEWKASSSDNIEGINYAVAQGAKVINMSLGNYGVDQFFEAAIINATNEGVICVGAAGNDNTTDHHIPSDYDECISVISINQSDFKSSFSNYGSLKDISAPGEMIRSTYIGGGYGYMSGTSMAAPVVSGVVALMLSVNPELTVDEVKNILYSTAFDLGENGKDDIFANGRVDAALAVEEAARGLIVEDVSLNADTLEMSTNGQETLAATIIPSTAADKTITWSSSNEAVATVSNGVVTAQGVGKAVITATTNDGGFTDTCDVTVYQGAVSISLDVTEADIYVGQSVTLSATVLPEDAVDKSVVWSSSDTGVATVENGVVTGVGSGATVITALAKDGEFTDTCTVNVAPSYIESSVYDIDRSSETITGVEEKTSVTQFKSNLSNNSEEIKVYCTDGTEYTGDKVATGMIVRRIINETITDELTVLVGGECNEDGVVSIADYTLVRLHILELKSLESPFVFAADVNGDGAVSIADYTLVRLHILELKSLY